MFTKRALSIVLLASIVMLATGVRLVRALPLIQEPDPQAEATLGGDGGLATPIPVPPKGWVTEQENVGQGLAAALAPPLGSFLDIWVDDVDNYNPAVAYNSRHDEYLVVWENDRGATRDIYARRVAGNGTLKSSFTIVSNANKWNYLPDVAYNPVRDEYLVVYTYQVNTSDYDIYARRVKWDGSWMSAEISVNLDAAKQWYPAVAYNSQNDEYLVVYENYWSGSLRDIAAQRVASDGVLLSWRNIATAPNTVRRLPDVAYNATRNEYLIAYTYQYNPTDGDIYGKVASANLGTLGTEMYIADTTFNQDGVALAAGPNEYLAVWEDGPSTTHRTIFGRRVSGAGALQPDFAIVDHFNQACVEVAAGYGPIYGYLVAWRFIGSSSHWDVYGRYVKAGQDSAWESEFAIDTGSDLQRSPALACGSRGDCLVVEEDNWPSADYEIRGRLALARHVYLPLVVRNS